MSRTYVFGILAARLLLTSTIRCDCGTRICSIWPTSCPQLPNQSSLVLKHAVTVALLLTILQYYKPYKLREEQKVQIKRQIEEAQDIIEDELYDFDRRRHEHDTPSEVRAAPKTEDETMEDAPSTVGELPAVQEELPKKDLDEEPFVSTLTTEKPNQAMTDAAPESQSQHNEPMEEEPATAGAEVDAKSGEEENSKADEEADVNAEDNRQAQGQNEANAEYVAKEAEGKDDEAKIKAEKEAQAEADMIDEHHGETVVEAEEDTVIY